MFNYLKFLIILFTLDSVLLAKPDNSSESTFLVTPNMGRYEFENDSTRFYGLNLAMILNSTSRDDILALDISHSTDVAFSEEAKYDLSIVEFDYLFNIYDVDFRMIDISRFWSEPDNKDVNIYLLAGFGIEMLKDGDNGTDTSMLISGGIGARYYWNRYMNLMGEYKNLYTSTENVQKITFGLSFAFTPKTKREYFYETHDRDSDGISDEFDKCPKTPLDAKVNVDGCLIDSDKDGVSDIYDLCPDTFKGFSVDDKGCKVNYRFYTNFSIDSVNLGFDSIEQKEIFYKDMQELSDFLKSNQEYRVELQGFTDNKKSPQYNKAYSERKAYMVMQYLMSYGIERSRLSYIGYGELMPIESNSSEFGRMQNSRVEAYIYRR